MKKFVCTFLLWWTGLLVGVTLAVGESGAEAVRLAKIKEAAFRSVQESIDQLEQHQMNPDQLAAMMLEEPATYQYERPSEALLRELERQRLRDAVRDQLEVFAGSRTDLRPGWVGKMMNDEEQRINLTVDVLLTKSFGSRYSEARNLAVKVQSVDLDAAVWPEPSEIEGLAGPSTNFVDLSATEIARIPKEHGQNLIKYYTDQVIADRQLFEENKTKIEGRVTDSIAEGLEELWRQLKFVDQNDGGGAVERLTLQAAIVAEVGRLRGHYAMFPSVLAFAGERAQSLESKLFYRYLGKRLDRQENCPGLPASTILEGLPASANRAPSSFEIHVQQRAKQLQPDLEKRLLDPWVSRVDDPELESELRRRLKTAMTSGRTVFNSALEDCVRIALEPYRQNLAVRELAQVWPEVADLTYELNDDVLRSLYEHDSQPQHVDENVLTVRPLHLEESRKIFEKKRRSLIEEGWTVIRNQVTLVLDTERRRRFQKSIRDETNRSEERRQYWQDEYEREVLGAWKVRRRRLTTEKRMLLPDKYNRILKLTRETIIEVITPIFLEPTPSDKDKEGGGGPKDEGPGSGTGEGPGGGGGPLVGDGGGGRGGGGGGCPDLEKEAQELRSHVATLESLLSDLRTGTESQRSETGNAPARSWSWILHLVTLGIGAGLASWYWKRS